MQKQSRLCNPPHILFPVIVVVSFVVGMMVAMDAVVEGVLGGDDDDDDDDDNNNNVGEETGGYMGMLEGELH